MEGRATIAGDPHVRVRPRMAAVVVAYNGGEDLRNCVRSLIAQTLGDLDIIVVDNASSEWSTDTIDLAEGRVRIIRRLTNGGYAAGANTGWRASTAEFVAVLNQDLVLAPDCLEKMEEALLGCASEALVTPKLVLKSDPSRVNAIGNAVHISGVASCLGLGTRADNWRGVHHVTAISGAAFLARRAFLERLGGLEEGYFMYMEDVDLSMRARETGAACLAACDAIATHGWQLRLEPGKFRLLERNRRALWRRFWGRRPDLYPYLVQAELMAWVYALSRGRAHVKAKQTAGRSKLVLPRLIRPPSSVLELTLLRSHPYQILFPGRPMIWLFGRTLDRAVAAVATALRILLPPHASGRDVGARP